MRWIYFALLYSGAALALWAWWSLPRGYIDFPVPRPIWWRLTRGPYRWLRNPMYVGTIMLLTGMGGLGGGFWNALAFLTLSEMVTREWAWREDDQD